MGSSPLVSTKKKEGNRKVAFFLFDPDGVREPIAKRERHVKTKSHKQERFAPRASEDVRALLIAKNVCAAEFATFFP